MPALLLLVLLAAAGAQQAQSQAADKEALLALKAASAPDVLAEWSESTLPCGKGRQSKWPYVECSNGRVHRLKLSGVQLDGTLPNELADLDELVML